MSLFTKRPGASSASTKPAQKSRVSITHVQRALPKSNNLKEREAENRAIRREEKRKQLQAELAEYDEEDRIRREAKKQRLQPPAVPVPNKVSPQPEDRVFNVNHAYCVQRDVAAPCANDLRFVHSIDVVSRSTKNYHPQPFFKDHSWDTVTPPSVTVLYPSGAASENFALLKPKDDNEYHPVYDVIETIDAVLENYLTPTQASELFHHAQSSDTLSVPPSLFISDLKREPTPADAANSPVPSSSSSPPLSALIKDVIFKHSQGLVGALIQARNRHARDAFSSSVPHGPGKVFEALIEYYNSTLEGLVSSGEIVKTIKAMKGVKESLWIKISSQAYARTVGPETKKLSLYKPHTDQVYGEMQASFVSRIIQLTGITASSVLCDLGSGVSNTLVQASLATGCESHGIEFMPEPSRLAQLQIKEAEARWAMWGLSGGTVQAFEADFLQDERVYNILCRADVVLCNNLKFSTATNEALLAKFLDMKDGAHIVSLASFKTTDSLTDRNDSNLGNNLEETRYKYGKGDVSWSDESNTFYVCKVDHSRLSKLLERRERERRGA